MDKRETEFTLSKILNRLIALLPLGLKDKVKNITFPDYTKFTLLSVLIGAVVGFATVIFHHSIDFFNNIFFERTAGGLFFLGAAAVITLPALGMLIQSLMISFAPEIAKKRGVPEVIKAVSMRGGRIPFRTTIFHFFAPVICIGSGGTVGPEGPAAQLGGGVASKIGQVLGLSDSRARMFTAVGSGAAIAAIFNTPMGGIFFAIEVVLLNYFQTSTFSALILSSVTASTISRIFLGDESVFRFGMPHIGSYEYLYLYAVLGILIGLTSVFYIRYSSAIDVIIKKKLLHYLPRWIVMTAAGLLVGVSGYFYNDIFGIGYSGINNILSHSLTWQVVLILLILKFLLVPIVLNTGGFGGTFAPSLFMGACFGYLFVFVCNYFLGFNLDYTTFILVGMGAMLGGINSIPIAAILIIFEMTTDYSFILPLMLAVVSSTMIVQIFLKDSVHVRHLQLQGYRVKREGESSTLKSISLEDINKNEALIIPENTPLPRVVKILMEAQGDTLYLKNNDGLLTGVITSSHLKAVIPEYENLREVCVASDIASPKVIKVSNSDDLDYVMKLFERKDVDEFPVTSENNPDEIIGTVRRRDVIAAYNRESLKQNLADGFARELKTINKMDISKVAEGYSIIEKEPKKEFIGKTLAQLRLRNSYGLEVLMVRKKNSPYSDSENEDGDLVVPAHDYLITEDDTLVLFGSDENIEKTRHWE